MIYTISVQGIWALSNISTLLNSSPFIQWNPKRFLNIWGLSINWFNTGDNSRFEFDQCMLDWTNQCNSRLPQVAKAVRFQTGIAAKCFIDWTSYVSCSGKSEATNGRRLLHWLGQSKIHQLNLRFSPVPWVLSFFRNVCRNEKACFNFKELT